MDPAAEDRIEDLRRRIATLPRERVAVLSRIAEAFDVELEITLNPHSDFATEPFAKTFGDVLLIHHTLSHDSFSKDKFEHGLEQTLRTVGIRAELASRGNPGHDITVRAERWSLKTQADRNIRPDRIHISKFMELGRGRWVSESDLAGLRDRMFTHMEQYDRIFTLRALSAAGARSDGPLHEYELVEIPQALLLQAAGVPCVMQQNSRQKPKPGTCTVTDDGGRTLFELYFDGGTERKLQVRNLQKASCRVHATWRFPRTPPPA